MRLLASKRGIAPLLATFLLIMLAGALGIVVMNFGRAQIETAAQCAIDIGLQTVVIDAREQVCVDKVNNNLFFIVENGPNIDVAKLRLRAIGSQAILVSELENSTVARNNALLYNQPYDMRRYGEVRQVKLTPLVQLYDEEILCDEKSLVIDNVREC